MLPAVLLGSHFVAIPVICKQLFYQLLKCILKQLKLLTKLMCSFISDAVPASCDPALMSCDAALILCDDGELKNRRRQSIHT